MLEMIVDLSNRNLGMSVISFQLWFTMTVALFKEFRRLYRQDKRNRKSFQRRPFMAQTTFFMGP